MILLLLNKKNSCLKCEEFSILLKFHNSIIIINNEKKILYKIQQGNPDCIKFYKNPNINPKTGYYMHPSSPEYKRYVDLCGQPAIKPVTTKPSLTEQLLYLKSAVPTTVYPTIPQPTTVYPPVPQSTVI